MTASTSTISQNESVSNNLASTQTRLYRLGGVMALLIVVTALLEIIITFLPGGYASADTVQDWFNLFQNNWFLGLRNLGLLNILMTTLGIPMFFALYSAHRETCQPYTTLALMFSLLGAAIFFATNRAFPMLDLSRQYAQAATEAERALLSAAGQAMLSVGESHTPGTFLAFFFSEVAGIMISLVMLRGRIFPVFNAIVGILGFGMLLVFDICTSFVPALSSVFLIFAMIGGLLSIAWYILISLRLFRLAKAS